MSTMFRSKPSNNAVSTGDEAAAGRQESAIDNAERTDMMPGCHRQAYRSPELVCYGTVAELTHNLFQGPFDGSIGSDPLGLPPPDSKGGIGYE